MTNLQNECCFTESWFDDLYDMDYDGPEDETQNGESWMDDLDEAA